MPGNEDVVLVALARLQHAAWPKVHFGAPLPPIRTCWWRDDRDPAIAEVIAQCERGIDETRDWIKPAELLEAWLTNIACKVLGERVRGPGKTAERFAEEMLYGRLSGGCYVSGLLQYWHLKPARAFIEGRVVDYVELWIAPDPARDAEEEREPRIARAPDGRVDVEGEALLAATGAEWRRLVDRACANLRPVVRQRLQYWGIDDDDDNLDPVIVDLIRPSRPRMDAAKRKERERTRNAFFEGLAHVLGFTTACELASALLADPERSRAWPLARASEYGDEAAWNAQVARLATSQAKMVFVRRVVLLGIRLRCAPPVPPTRAARSCTGRQVQTQLSRPSGAPRRMSPGSTARLLRPGDRHGSVGDGPDSGG